MAKKPKVNKSKIVTSADTPIEVTDPYPQVTTRVSQDDGFNPYLDIKQYWGNLGIVPSKIPVQIYDIVDHLVLTDPYVNKYHHSTIALANSGHTLTITAPSAQQAQRAIDEANRLAERCFPISGGMYGLASGTFSQLARTGATCVEWVPNSSYDYVAEGFLVPIRTLRFTYNPDGMGYILCQQQIGLHEEHIGIVPLNMAQTYFYNSISTDGNPYPTPPIISSLQSCQIHKKIVDKIGKWMDKLSSLGVMLASIEPPPRFPGETQANYDLKAQTYLDKIAQSIGDNMQSGLGVAYNNVAFTFQNTQAGASGANDLLQMVLQGVFAGLGTDPVMMGWATGRSDSFVKILYEELQQSLKFYQVGVAKIIEMGHRLNFALLGLGGCDVKVAFKAARSLDQFRDSEAEYMDSKKILEQMMSVPPAISVGEARKALGYDALPILAAETYIADFTIDNNSYKLLAKDANIFPVIADITNDEDSGYTGKIESIISAANSKGFQAFSAWLAIQLKLSRDSVVREGLDTYLSALEESINQSQVSQTANKELTQIWHEAQNNPKLFSKSAQKLDTTNRSSDEVAALAFLAMTVEPWLVKNYVSRSDWRLNRIRTNLSKLYEQNDLESPSADKINAFRSDASKFFQSLGKESARDMGDIAVTRAASWASVFALRNSGVERFMVVGPEDERKCAYCYSMLGKVFSVQREVDNINEIVKSEKPDMGSVSDFLMNKYSVSQLDNISGEDVQADGFAAPPYHNNCRDSVQAI